MSTSSRINKSTTKFVPKRKQLAPTSISRAPSATPSSFCTLPQVAPSPVIHKSPLPPTPTPRQHVSHQEEEEEFRIPALPPRPKPPPPSNAFSLTPSDPSASSSFSLRPSDPSSRPPPPSFSQSTSTSPSTSARPTPSPAKKITPGTSFSVSIAGPSSAPQPQPESTLDRRDDDQDDGRERTQREIEEEALSEEQAREAAKGKGKGTAKGKGKKRAVEGDEEEESGDPKAAKKPRKPRVKKVVPPTAEGEVGEPSTDSSKKRKRAPSSKEKKKKKTGEDGDEEESDSESGYEALRAQMAAKRLAKANAAKDKPKEMGEVDKTIFGFEDEDDDEESDEEGEGEEQEDSDGNIIIVKKKRKSKKNKKEKKVGFGQRIEVDPTITTMSQLATPKDLVDGRTSSRGKDIARKAEEIKLRRKEARRKMRDRAERRSRGEQVDSEEEGDYDVDFNGKREDSVVSRRVGSPDISAIERGERFVDNILDDYEEEEEQPEAVANGSAAGDEDEDDDDVGELVETQYAPQMRIVDGQLVIDDASLEIDRGAEAQRINDGFGQREVIEESARDRFVNSASWGKVKRTEKWTADETTLFYDSLSRFGTDFEMIAGLFPTRTRRQIKAKWNKEDRTNPKGITAALMRRKTIDLESYAKATGQNLSGPVPDDPYEKVQKMREEYEKESPTPRHHIKKGEDEDRHNPRAGQSNTYMNMDDVAEEEEPEDVAEDDEAEEERQKEVDREIAEAEEAEREARKKRKGKGKALG